MAIAPRASSRLAGRTFVVCIGAQKSGTTWLANYLRRHPDAFVSDLKELHYFDAVYRTSGGQAVARRMAVLRQRQAERVAERRDRKQARKLADFDDRLRMTSEEDYLRYFEQRIGDEAVFCDITPGYSMLNASGFEAIRRTHQPTKFLFIMRDPVQRFWSSVRKPMRRRPTYDADAAFADDLESSEERLERTNYPRIIRELERAVPAEEIRYFFFEELFRQETIDSLTDFLGIGRRAALVDQVSNLGPEAALRPEHAVAAAVKLRPVYEFVFDRFGDAVPDAWRRSHALALQP